MTALDESVRVQATGSSVPDSSRVAVVIPCHDEAGTIGRVVGRFRELLPDAEVLVVDNASHDETARVAEEAGARVVGETRLGKGFALMAGFQLARDADYYVMVDGDDTYPASDVARLLHVAEQEGADMVIGTRLESDRPGAFPPGHGLGNRLFIWLVRLLFGIRTRDLLSGYRVLTSRFLATVPLVATGFDVEAELSVQAQSHGFRVAEVPVAYRPRPSQSRSKLRTLRDGAHILSNIMILFRDYRPLSFFGSLCAALFAASLLCGYAPVDDFVRTGFVDHLPRAVLAAALFILAALSLAVGVLLSSINRRSAELAMLIRKRSS
ncbi:MAG: glycosyltransferase [Deltaproteobacteria bacterium]|nr:glycosyltransferase [Deltaproteobacteria bacterium]MBW2384701.1 glycosyltransferase [Deltaproteobacteria bacterium]MBW2696148.1 glycosyltransferase [Deltaproteobacteria bacterium]